MDTNILDTMLNSIATQTVGATGTLTGFAQSTFGLLILLDFTIAIMLNLGEVDHIKQVMKKILVYGFWLWLITNWDTFCNAILDSLMTAGTSIGGVDASVLKQPSQLIDKGFNIAKPYMIYATDQSFTQICASPLVWLTAVIGFTGVIAAFTILALQIFITYVEFYIAAALMLIFIPWGTFKFTSFVAEKAIGAVISYGTKLMMLGAVYGLCSGVINSLTPAFDGNPDLKTVFGLMLGPFALGLLTWQAPGMAAGLMNGAPSLTAGTAAGTAAASMAGGAAAAMGASSVSGGAARTAAGLAGSMAGGASSVDADTMPAKGAARAAASHIASGAANAFGVTGAANAFKGAYDKAASAGSNGEANSQPQNTEGARSAVSGLSGAVGGMSTDSSASGSKTGAEQTQNSASAGNTGSTADSMASQAGIGAEMGSSNTAHAGTGNFQDVLNKTKEAVPQDAQPEGGMSVPLPKDD